MHNNRQCLTERERERETFEKWYPSGTDILRYKLPSLDELPSTLTISASANDRRLSRFNDLDFGVGGWTPFSSKVISSGSSLFRSRYLITLLFVSAMKSLPAEEEKKERKETMFVKVYKRKYKHFKEFRWRVQCSYEKRPASGLRRQGFSSLYRKLG